MNIKIILSTIFLTIVISSCNNNFEEINTNPSAPVQVQPEFLLRQVLYNQADLMTYEGFVAGNLLGQYFTAIDFNLFDRHSLTESQYGGNPWLFLFQNLRDNEILLQKAQENPAFEVYRGPALIMKAYLTNLLTDLYGDIPYSAALQGKSGITSPKFDDQKSVYLGEKGILKTLETAVAAIDNYKGAIKLQGDVVYSGDLKKWRKLAITLRLKYLMRISNVENVSAELKTLVAENDLILSSNYNANFAFTPGPPNSFKMVTARIGDFNLFIMSATAEEIFKKYSDPRMAVFFRPTANNFTEYKGLLNGPDASKLAISVSNYSFSGKIFREEASRLKANFMCSFETQLLLAEAAERNLITGDAKTYYENGVKQAFAYWYTDVPADYLSTGPASYKASGQNALEQIITQKWIASSTNGYEGWIEYRRTGFPKLKTISASLNQNLIPVRLPYPTTEATLNAANFKTAAAVYNNNSVNTPMWWDK